MTTALVIFDCDGVLVDSEPAANRVFSELLVEAGFPIDEATAHRELVGHSLSYCFAWVEGHFGKRLPIGFEATLRKRTYEAFEQELEPVAGIPEVLQALQLPYCVASSGPHEKMRISLGLTGLWQRFEGRIFSATQVPRSKPYPDLFLFAAAEMGARPEVTVVVEDSVPGVQAAKAAGMRVLGYIGGAFAQPLQAAGAEVFDHTLQLPVLVAVE